MCAPCPFCPSPSARAWPLCSATMPTTRSDRRSPNCSSLGASRRGQGRPSWPRSARSPAPGRTMPRVIAAACQDGEEPALSREKSEVVALKPCLYELLAAATSGTWIRSRRHREPNAPDGLKVLGTANHLPPMRCRGDHRARRGVARAAEEARGHRLRSRADVLARCNDEHKATDDGPRRLDLVDGKMLMAGRARLGADPRLHYASSCSRGSATIRPIFKLTEHSERWAQRQVLGF